MNKITINGREYTVSYGYVVIKTFCKEQSIEFCDYLQKITGFNYVTMSFEIIEFYAALLKSMILTANPDASESVSDELIADEFTKNPHVLGMVIKIVLDGMPKADNTTKKVKEAKGKKKEDLLSTT